MVLSRKKFLEEVSKYHLDNWPDAPPFERKLLDGEIWIPVTERLPENNRKVFVVYTYEDNKKYIGLDFYRNNRWFHEKDFIITCEVTHWMPVPEIPE
jgi:hypothetical protein